MGQYRDNNNYFEFNEVTTSDHRGFQMFLQNQYQFLNLDVRSGQVSNGFKHKYKYSRDGQDYQTRTDEVLSATYFFLSNKRIIHQRSLQNAFGVLANVGGLAVFLYLVLGTLGKYINTRLFMANLISQNYSQQENDTTRDDSKKLGSIINDTS